VTCNIKVSPARRRGRSIDNNWSALNLNLIQRDPNFDPKIEEGGGERSHRSGKQDEGPVGVVDSNYRRKEGDHHKASRADATDDREQKRSSYGSRAALQIRKGCDQSRPPRIVVRYGINVPYVIGDAI